MSNSPSDAKERVLFEGQRVTIIANAAGALALLAFLQSIWMQAGAVSLKRAVLWGIAGSQSARALRSRATSRAIGR